MHPSIKCYRNKHNKNKKKKTKDSAFGYGTCKYHHQENIQTNISSNGALVHTSIEYFYILHTYIHLYTYIRAYRVHGECNKLYYFIIQVLKYSRFYIKTKIFIFLLHDHPSIFKYVCT